LWRSEFADVLLAHLKRGLVSPEQGRAAIGESVVLIPESRTLSPDLRKVVEIALASGCTAYDCEYVVVARVLQVGLVTWDKKVLSAFPDLAMAPEDLLRGQ